MRRTHYLVIILLLIAQTSFGQIYQNMAQPGYKFSRARFDSVLTIPTGLGNLKNISGGQDTGQIRFNKSDSSVYVWNGRAWIKAGGGTIPTLTQVLESAAGANEAGANQIKDLSAGTSTFDAATFGQLTDTANLRLRISDTASMLSNYAKTAAVNLKLNITDTIGNGNLFIRNLTTQENKSFNVKGGRLDTLYASTSAGGRVVSNSGSVAAEWGVGGGRNFDFHGFAGYNLNRASNYTARSFTDKNYVDSSLTLKTTVTSYGKNAGGDSTILLLSNGTRYAAKDSVGGGGASGWALTGNASAVTDFLGTTNNRTLRFRTNNTERLNIDSSSGLVSLNNNISSVNSSIFGVPFVSIKSVDAASPSFNQEWQIRKNAHPSQALSFYNVNTASDRMVIFPGGSGGVGINTNVNNGFALEVNGTVKSGGITATGLSLTGGSINDLQLPNFRFRGFGGHIRIETTSIIMGNIHTTDNSLVLSNQDLGGSTANTSSVLEVRSTNKGVLFPRMTTTQKNAIASPAAGLVVYDTTLNKLCVRTASAWETITSL